MRVVVATGRMFRSVRPYLDQAGVNGPAVCYQGAVVADPASGEFLRHVPIRLELAREAIAAVEEEGFPLNCYVGDELYVARETPESAHYAETQNVPLTEVGDLLAWLSEPPTKLVALGEPKALDGLRDRLRERFRERLYIAKSLPYFLEIADPDATKASGIEFAARLAGFDLARTAAFGDGENDLELFGVASYRVAVANADERLLALADLVCPSVSEEGVAQVLEAFVDSAP